MEFTQFGQRDLKVSKICFGTGQARGDWGSVEESDTKAAIRKALDLGLNFYPLS